MAQCMYNTILLTHVQIPSTHVSAACGIAHAFNSSTGHKGLLPGLAHLEDTSR